MGEIITRFQLAVTIIQAFITGVLAWMTLQLNRRQVKPPEYDVTLQNTGQAPGTTEESFYRIKLSIENKGDGVGRIYDPKVYLLDSKDDGDPDVLDPIRGRDKVYLKPGKTYSSFYLVPISEKDPFICVEFEDEEIFTERYVFEAKENGEIMRSDKLESLLFNSFDYIE